VVRHAVTSHRQISGNAVTSAFTAIHPVLNRNQRRYHVKKLKKYVKLVINKNSNGLIFCVADTKLSLWKHPISVWPDADFTRKFALHPLEFS
jgi:hypothetical protein